MKKNLVLCLIFLLLITTACKKDDTNLENNISKITLTGDLVTKKLYYHNVAEYDGSKSSFLLRLFGVDKKAWIEYTGLTDLSIDLTGVKITTKGKTIHVFIPKTKINRVYVKNDDPDDIIFYNSDGKIFNLGNVSSSEGTEALTAAQNKMTEIVKSDTALLRMAQIRAKILIEEKIKEFAQDSDLSYTIEWEYEDNSQQSTN